MSGRATTVCLVCLVLLAGLPACDALLGRGDASRGDDLLRDGPRGEGSTDAARDGTPAEQPLADGPRPEQALLDLPRPDQAKPDAGVVGNPSLFTQPVLELDFSQGANGSWRAGGGAWQSFNSWNQAGSGGGWTNSGVYVQTTAAVRTELVANALGAGKVLRDWIEAGDEWHAGAAYPRTELTSSHASDVPFKSEWRLELPFYASGDVSGTSDSILGFQLHHNGNTGSPPFGLFLTNGTLRFLLEEESSGKTWDTTPILPLQASTRYEVVVELKFGYASDGAYVKLWVNGKQYVNLSGRNVGYPDVESNAGYWKLCSLYDWASQVNGSRSIYCGPIVRLLRKP